MELTGEGLNSLRKLMKNDKYNNGAKGKKGNWNSIVIRKQHVENDSEVVSLLNAVAALRNNPVAEGDVVKFSAFLADDKVPIKLSKNLDDVYIKIDLPYEYGVDNSNKYGGGAKKKRAKSRRGRSRRRSRSRSKKR